MTREQWSKTQTEAGVEVERRLRHTAQKFGITLEHLREMRARRQLTGIAVHRVRGKRSRG